MLIGDDTDGGHNTDIILTLELGEEGKGRGL